jgi:hypothetical protein
MQLTWTDAIFSRIALVSHFCAEIQLSVKKSGKIMKNPISPKDPRNQKTGGKGGLRGPHALVVWPSPGRATLA